MEENKVQNKMSTKQKIIIWSITAVVVLAIAVGSIMIVLSLTGKEEQSVAASSEVVINPNEGYVTGTGIIEANENYDVTAMAKGEVLYCSFEEGQMINAGDVLYKVDTKDIDTAIERARLGVEKAQLAYNQTADNMRKLNVPSTVTGTVKNVYVHNGDTVPANGKIADVINDDQMTLKVPFLSDQADQLFVGQSAQVTIVGTSYTVNGTVSKVTGGRMISADGSSVRMVEIDIQNPGAVNEGAKGTAVIGSIACNDAGDFEFGQKETIIAEVAGQVKNLNLSVCDRVSRGQNLLTLSNDSYETAQQTNALTIKDAKLALQSQMDQLKNYTITAQKSGKILKKNVKQGDTLTGANGPLATISDLSTIKFKMDVDELDVPQVQIGQKVDISVDALPDQAFTGTVDYIDVGGTTVSGVALYKVTVVVDNPEGLLPGMNVNAKIAVI